MSQRKKIALALLLTSGLVLACEIYPSEFVTPPISVNVQRESGEFWDELGKKLDALYGGTMRNVEIPVVRVPVVSQIFGVSLPPKHTTFLKPCGKTFKEAARDLAAEAREIANEGGGGGAPDDGGLAWGGDDPWKDCVGTTVEKTGCVSVDGGPAHCQTVEVPALACPSG